MDLKLSKVKVKLPGSARVLFKVPQWEIPAGTHLLIHGPSGQGKTTLLHLLAGLFLPDEGWVEVGAKELTKLSEVERSRIRREHFGIIFQKLNLLEHLTACENVMLAESPRLPVQDAKNRAAQALQKVGLGEQLDQLSVSLSLGEQQRVAVARVLAREPEVILADEPTSSLDAANAETVIKALLRAAHGRTLIVVSHDERIRSYFKNHQDFGQWVSA